MEKPHESFTFTVGKLDAGMAILIGERAHLIEFPSLLLPPGVDTGSIVNIAVHRNTVEEKRQMTEFRQLQEDIYQTFGLKSPQNPQLELRNVTQTSVTLEWPPLELATAKLRSLDIYKNGQRLASIPSPSQNTSTKLSGLELDTEYTLQLILRTTAGTYPSNTIRVRTHKMTDTSGISVCFGNVQDGVLLEHAKIALREMRAKWSDKIQIDTTHFVCTTPAAPANGSQASSGAVPSGPGVEYQRALQLSIPVVQPHWILACHGEKKMVPIANYYLGTTPSASLSSVPFTRPQSMQNPPGQPSSTPHNHRASLPQSSSSGSTSSTSPISHSSSFVNQAESEESEDLGRGPSASKSRSRNGTMRKDFKFPASSSTAPAAPAPATAPPPQQPSSTTDAQERSRPESKAGGSNTTTYEIAPQEIPPPPPVEKEVVQAAEDEDGEDDVGLTVEVDLS